jgi:hypothetical protein
MRNSENPGLLGILKCPNFVLWIMRMTKKLNVLIAEDNPDELIILREAFKKAGVRSCIQEACGRAGTWARPSMRHPANG